MASPLINPPTDSIDDDNMPPITGKNEAIVDRIVAVIVLVLSSTYPLSIMLAER